MVDSDRSDCFTILATHAGRRERLPYWEARKWTIFKRAAEKSIDRLKTTKIP